MKSLGTEFKVGVFTILALSSLGYMFFVLRPESFDRKEFHRYYTILTDAANIIERTQVKTNGVTVGKVTSVELEKNRTRVTLEVDSSVKIPTGSTLEIRTTGLLGDAHIEIIRVEDTGEYIGDNGYIPLSTDKLGINQVISLIGSIAKDIKKITASISSVFDSGEGDSKVNNITTNVERFTENLNAIADANRDDIRTIVANLKESSDTIQKVLGSNEADLVSIIQNFRESTEDIKKFTTTMKELMDSENKNRIERILASFEQSATDIQSTTANVKLVAEKVERGEGTLGKLISDEQTIAEVQGALRDIRQVLAPATKLQIGVDVRSEVQKTGSAQTFFNLEFRTRPDRYYLLGVTDQGRDITETTSEIYAADAPEEETPIQPPTRERKTTIEDRGLKFNAQFAKRWYFATLRLGLFESTGGVAADLHFLSDRLRLTVEAYDWEKRDLPDGGQRMLHLKSYASILFFNHIYALIGVEFDNPKVTEPFAGLGLSFNDQDLKAIFGTAALAL